MDLKDVKTLRQVSEESGIYIKTLQKRLDSKNVGMLEGEDFIRLGDRQPVLLSPAGVKKITEEGNIVKGIQYLESSTRKDLTEQEIKWFYSAAGIVLNYMCKHIKGFNTTSNYRNALNSSLAHNAEKLKDYINRLAFQQFGRFLDDSTKDIELFKKAMLNVIEYGQFDLTVNCYIENFADIYLLSSRAGNKYGINEEVL